MKNNTINTISLFTGCGGLDLGIEGGFKVHKNSYKTRSKQSWVRVPKTPFKVIMANDIMANAKKVWDNNFKGTYINKSIDELLEDNYQFPAADLVIGGFPCQDFSLAGNRKGFDSERGQLYKSMADVIRKVKPKAFIAENVYGLMSIEGALDTIKGEFEKCGYTVFVCPVSADDYGVPQSRKRVFFVGLKKSDLKRKVTIDDILPKATHKKHVVLSDIFKDLPEPDRSNDIAQMSYSKAKFYGSKCQGNREVDLQKVGPTIRAEHHGNIEFRRLSESHGGQQVAELKRGLAERRLTIRECARIQTFPDDFKFIKTNDGESIISPSAAYKVVGNAVPPLLAYHFAKKLADIWDEIL